MPQRPDKNVTPNYPIVVKCFFFFNDTATTEIYTLSLHDALPICSSLPRLRSQPIHTRSRPFHVRRSEEHTSELQSRSDLVCRLLLEKKNTYVSYTTSHCLPFSPRLSSRGAPPT